MCLKIAYELSSYTKNIQSVISCDLCYLFTFLYCWVFKHRHGWVRRRKWQPTPVLLPGESHGRSVVGYSPWGCKESDTTEWPHFTFTFTFPSLLVSAEATKAKKQSNGEKVSHILRYDVTVQSIWWRTIYSIMDRYYCKIQNRAIGYCSNSDCPKCF